MLLSTSNVAKSFGLDQVLTGVNFRLEAREKVALVGRNGTGKTTLLKIITGQMAPDSGTVQLAKGAKVGYLRQEAPVDTGRSVMQEAEEAVKQQLELRRRLDELEVRLEKGGNTAEDLEEYALLHEHFMEAEGYSAERDLRVVLQRMGFDENEFEKPTAKLSGGEKTRLAIARLLLEEPDLLILDEPTNHLDLQATEWLEGWLRQYHGAVLLVSHDRAFLQNTADRVLLLTDGSVKAYPGPFEKYLQLKAEEEARQAEVAKRQAGDIAKMDEFVRRFMNSQRTAQARGRLKLMNRMKENQVHAPKNERGMKAGFGDAKRSGDIVVSTDKLTVGFPSEAGIEYLYKDFDWVVRNGERWGVIGENGAGKSTLIKVIMGTIEALGGKVRLGSNVLPGYFSQDAEDLNLDESPLDTLVYDLDMKPPEARNLLARFLISGDDVYRPIRTMSGGEKNKLSLAKLTELNPNLLVLDEPTNHLDMDSREALAEVIAQYKGTLILVSHDRWLLSRVTDHTLDIRHSGPIIFQGSYTEYRSRSIPGAEPIKPAEATKKNESSEQPQEPALSPRELSKEISRMEKVVVEVEQQIADQEAELKELEDRLANLPPTADVYALSVAHQELQEMLEGSLAAWEEQSTRLEKLREMQGSS